MTWAPKSSLNYYQDRRCRGRCFEVLLHLPQEIQLRLGWSLLPEAIHWAALSAWPVRNTGAVVRVLPLGTPSWGAISRSGIRTRSCYFLLVPSLLCQDR